MRFFGITIGDLLSLASLLALVLGGLVTFVKKMVIDPTVNTLANSLDSLTDQLKDSQADRQAIHGDISRIDNRLIRVEDKQMAHEQRYNEHLKTYHRERSHHEN